MKRRDGEYAKSARAADIYTSCRSETKRKAARRAARCGLCQNRQRQTWTGGPPYPKRCRAGRWDVARQLQAEDRISPGLHYRDHSNQPKRIRPTGSEN
jgi:hypothetical protein